MIDVNALWTTSRPWLHVVPDEINVAQLDSLAPVRPWMLAQFEGARMRTVDDLFGEFVREFRFPDYFGWNWPAYAECLGDLEWLPARAYLVVVRRPELLLSESPADRDTFYRIINGVCSRWARSFSRGPEWGGGEVPFNVALLCKESAIEDMKTTIDAYV